MRWMWIDRIVELAPRERLVAIKHVSMAEEHLHDAAIETRPDGPRVPVMPMSLVIEGMAQTAGLLVGHAGGFAEKVILAKITHAQLDRDAVAGQTIRYTATLARLDPAGASTEGVVELADAREPGSFAPLGRIDLMFSHVDQNLAGEVFPAHNFVFGESFKTLLCASGVEIA